MKYSEIIIQDYKMISHLAMSKCHQSKYKGTIIAKDTPIDGKVIYVENEVFKSKKGEEFSDKSKVERIVYLEGKPKKEIFKSVKDLIKFYCKDLITE